MFQTKFQMKETDLYFSVLLLVVQTFDSVYKIPNGDHLNENIKPYVSKMDFRRLDYPRPSRGVLGYGR